MKKIVLIGGMPRSGTNLTRRLIGSHAKIAVPPVELNFFHKYVRGKNVETILSGQRLAQLGIDLSELYALEPKEAFITTLMRYRDSVGKEIAGEKSPLNEFYYDLIQDWLQGFEVKFIHLIRNPVDMMASFKHAPFRGEKRHKSISGIAALSRNWYRSVALGLARARSEPEGYFVLKYEDLLNDPAGLTETLCAFLGVDFEPERMLNLADYHEHRDNTSFPDDPQTQPAAHAVRSLKSRRAHLDRSELHTVISICGELAQALGYTDEDFRSSPPERPPSGLRGRLRRVAATYFL